MVCSLMEFGSLQDYMMKLNTNSIIIHSVVFSL